MESAEFMNLDDFPMIVSLMKLLKKLSHKALVENTSNLL